MITGPFLTSLDTRGAVKGSRDPLGAQSIWVRFGRYVVGNLTTQSTLVQDFTVLLTGLFLCERVADEERERGGGDLEVFLRWEQLCAYVRQRKGIRGFRGIERARRRLEDSTKVTLSSASQHQVLGDQRIYGIWGLYMVAARASGLVVDGAPRLSPAGRALVESAFVPSLCRGNATMINRLVRQLGRIEPWVVHLDGRDAEVESAVVRILSGKRGPLEIETYRKHLVRGGPEDSTKGLQEELATLIIEHTGLELDGSSVRALAKEARRVAGKDSALALRLERIRACEAVLGPATRIFSWLLGQTRRPRDEIARDLRRALGPGVAAIDLAGLREMKDDFAAAAGHDGCERWMAIAERLQAGDAGAVIESILVHNREVMRVRNGSSPWAEFNKNELVVHFTEEQSPLFTRAELPRLWGHPYFVRSLQAVIEQVEGAAG